MILSYDSIKSTKTIESFVQFYLKAIVHYNPARRSFKLRCHMTKAFLMRPANTMAYMVRFRFRWNGSRNLSI